MNERQIDMLIESLRSDAELDIEDKRDIYDALCYLRTELTDERKRLGQWRAWAQLVYLGGGPITLHDDDALRAAVCSAQDAAYSPGESA